MITVNVHEAKTNLSRLLNRVESGEEIVIAKAGKPVARVVPIPGRKKTRKPGSAKGRIFVRENFYEPLSETVLKEFES